MASLTRKAIMESFIRLLDERPLNKISVKDIVEDCGINRNTFYYYFTDIPTLVEEIVRDEADRIVLTAEGISSLEECVDAAMRLSREHRRAIWHIYNSANRSIYERYLLAICGHVVKAFIDNVAGDRAISDEDRSIIIQGYKCELFGLITDWLSHGMPEDMEARVLRLCELRRGMTEELIERAAGERD